MTWQDMAEVLEAVVWERAKSIRNKRDWLTVATDMVASLDATWPKALCTYQQSASVAVKLDVEALRYRFVELH